MSGNRQSTTGSRKPDCCFAHSLSALTVAAEGRFEKGLSPIRLMLSNPMATRPGGDRVGNRRKKEAQQDERPQGHG